MVLSAVEHDDDGAVDAIDDNEDGNDDDADDDSLSLAMVIITDCDDVINDVAAGVDAKRGASVLVDV